MRLTRQRKMLLDLFDQGDKPLNAESLLERLPDGFMNLSTVYRNLDRFHQEGWLGQSVMEGRAYYYRNKEPHRHFMICLTCQKMVPVDCRLEAMAHQAAARNHFQITHHDMTIYGYCRDCQKLNAKSERK
ncbi:MAG: Fur family transcriptional regulator [Bacilli bacterium]